MSYVEIIIKNHVLELQNIELEINLQIQEKMIADMKQIITSQRQLIADNHIDLKANLDDDLILAEEDVLELEEEFEDDNE